MAKKMYSRQGNEESVLPLSCFTDEIPNLKESEEVILVEQERDFGNGFMWCIELGEFIEKGDNDCGEDCEHYKPRNGKSGRCKFLDNTFKRTGKVFRLKKDGLEEKVCLHIKIQSIGAMITEITQALNKAGQSVRAKEFQVRAIGCGEVSGVFKIASDYVGILNSRVAKND